MSGPLHTPGHRWELRAVFVIGIVFVAVLVLIAITLPRPTPFQETVFRVVLALAAAGIAALLPGFLALRFRKSIRAGGALAVFFLIYFFNPAALVLEGSPLPTDLFTIYVVSNRDDSVVTDTYKFPVSDIRNRRSGPDFLKLLSQLPHDNIANLDALSVFQISNEKEITRSTRSVLGNRNLGALVIPKSLVQSYGDPHLAFTHIFSQLPKSE